MSTRLDETLRDLYADLEREARADPELVAALNTDRAVPAPSTRHARWAPLAAAAVTVGLIGTVAAVATWSGGTTGPTEGSATSSVPSQTEHGPIGSLPDEREWIENSQILAAHAQWEIVTFPDDERPRHDTVLSGSLTFRADHTMSVQVRGCGVVEGRYAFVTGDKQQRGDSRGDALVAEFPDRALVPECATAIEPGFGIEEPLSFAQLLEFLAAGHPFVGSDPRGDTQIGTGRSNRMAIAPSTSAEIEPADRTGGPVPDVLGLSPGDAEAALEAAGVPYQWNRALQTTGSAPSSEGTAGIVVAMTPEPGARLPTGERVQLWTLEELHNLPLTLD